MTLLFKQAKKKIPRPMAIAQNVIYCRHGTCILGACELSELKR